MRKCILLIYTLQYCGGVWFSKMHLAILLNHTPLHNWGEWFSKMYLAILLNYTPLHHWGLWFNKMHLAILLSSSIQYPKRSLFYLLTLCGLPVSRRCRRQAANCLRSVSPPVLLGGVRAYTATPGSSPLLCDWEYKAGGWENTKDCKLQGKVLHAQIR